NGIAIVAELLINKGLPGIEAGKPSRSLVHFLHKRLSLRQRHRWALRIRFEIEYEQSFRIGIHSVQEMVHLPFDIAADAEMKGAPEEADRQRLRAAFVVIRIDEIRTLSRLVDDAEDS